MMSCFCVRASGTLQVVVSSSGLTSPVDRKRACWIEIWRGSAPTRSTGNPIFSILGAISALTSWPVASPRAAHSACVLALPYLCFWRLWVLLCWFVLLFWWLACLWLLVLLLWLL